MVKLKPSDLILAKREGDPTAIIAKLDQPDDKDREYINAMKRWCDVAGIDPFVALTQFLVETDNATSVRWVRDANAAGIGIPANSTVQPFTIADGDEAARIHAQALYSAVTKHLHPGIPVPDAAQPWFTDVWLPKVNHPNYPVVMTVNDLNTRYSANGDSHATWAWDDQYVSTLISRAATFYPDLQPQSSSVPAPPAGGPSMKDSEGYELNMTPGLIPEAGYADRLIPDRNNDAWDDLGQRHIKGFVLHRMLGSLAGTDSYFNQHAQGLTDMGAQASSDLVYRWNDPTGAAHPGVSPNRAGWATGPLRATAYGDGLKFANKYGINAINRDQRSWEIDGFYGDPWSKAAMQEAAQTCACDAHNYGITWEQFPIAPQDGFSFVRWHNETTGTDYKECPGSVVMAQTDDFIAMTKGIMKAAQQIRAQPPAEPPKPIPVSPYPKGMTPELARELYGSFTVAWASKPFAFDINRSECRRWLAWSTQNIPAGGNYTAGNWGTLVNVIRRGNKGSNGRDYVYSNGLVIHQEPPDKQKGPKPA